jgi:hypothetical protein
VDLTEVFGQPRQIPSGAGRYRGVEGSRFEQEREPFGVGHEVIDVPVGGQVGLRIGVHEARR